MHEEDGLLACESIEIRGLGKSWGCTQRSGEHILAIGEVGNRVESREPFINRGLGMCLVSIIVMMK